MSVRPNPLGLQPTSPLARRLAGGPQGRFAWIGTEVCLFTCVCGPLIHGRLRWHELIRRCFASCHQGCVPPLFLLKSLHSAISKGHMEMVLF
jgi:hypothetical protein